MNKLISNLLNTFLILLISGASSSFVMAESQPAQQAKKSTAELEALRDEIKRIKSSIDETQSESASLRKKLEASEAEVEAAIQESKRLDEKIRKKQEALKTLEEEQAQHNNTLQKHRKILLQQVLTTYQQSQHPNTHKLLFTGSTQEFAQLRVFQTYVNQARSEKLREVANDLHALKDVKAALRMEANQLRLLKDQQDQQMTALTKSREKRTKLIAQLDSKLANQASSLKQMQADESRLKRLISSLKKAAKKLALEKQRRANSFANLKGKLRWPSAGAIMHSFGSPRVGSKLSWQGVLIKAPLGSEVKAISSGTVIFSDWFQNLGQLVIVDHGQDYLSLYGHNEELFKQVGDKVKKGDVIASVGDTGGRRNSGLYFEIRQKSRPVNPAIWCKK